MPQIQAPVISARIRLTGPIALVLSLLGASAGVHAETEDSPAYIIEVGDVTAKVGDPTIMHATLKIREGYRILSAYTNHLSQLSSWDGGVAFAEKIVRPTLQDGALLFAVDLRATRPGRHPINGVFRVGYIHGTDEMAMVSLPLIAAVTGTS